MLFWVMTINFTFSASLSSRGQSHTSQALLMAPSQDHGGQASKEDGKGWEKLGEGSLGFPGEPALPPQIPDLSALWKN